MKRRFLLYALAPALILPPIAADARWDDRDAKHACKREVRYEFNARDFHGVVVNRRGRNDFNITGVAERSNGRSDIAFECVIRDREVVSLDRVDQHKSGSSKGAAVLAGAVLGAVIVGALSKNHKHDGHREHGENERGWGSGTSRPASGVICYNDKQMCYSKGQYSPYWTDEEYN